MMRCNVSHFFPYFLFCRVFAEGQSYVALSRARSLASLRVIAFDPSAIRANKNVIRLVVTVFISVFYKARINKCFEGTTSRSRKPLLRRPKRSLFSANAVNCPLNSEAIIHFYRRDVSRRRLCKATAQVARALYTTNATDYFSYLREKLQTIRMCFEQCSLV